MNVYRKKFGVFSDGCEAELYTLDSGEISFSISSFGAAWTSLIMPGKTGKNDIFLGYSSLDGYLHDSVFFGSTIGRFANRIASAEFNLGGKNYTLIKNDGNNSLHGGRRGFHKRLWTAYPYTNSKGAFVRFELESPDGEEGYPGNLKAIVTYGLSFDNEIYADYKVELDAPCPVNITNHAYFNLAGEGNGDILSHQLRLHASAYVECNEELIPTGNLIPVAGTPFDFSSSKTIGRDYSALCNGDINAIGKGYDHCFVLNKDPDKKKSDQSENGPALYPCAEIKEPVSGRSFQIFTSQPGVQFYSGNFLNGVAGKTGSQYHKNAGFCLETQHFPDTPNLKEFPPAIFGPDNPYHEKALFCFDW